jgi:IclR family transcriptional regulator, KDG regulon repressor
LVKRSSAPAVGGAVQILDLFLVRDQSMGIIDLSAVLVRLDVADVAMPHLEALMRRDQEEVHVGVFVQGEVVYVSKAEAFQLPRMNSRVGLRAPAFCTSIGRALLAYQPEAVIQGVLKGPLPQYTSRTVTFPAELRIALRDAAKNGYATSFEEFEIGLNSVGAPVFGPQGSIIAGISIWGPAHRLDASTVSHMLRESLEATAAVSAELGYDQRSETARVTCPRRRRAGTLRPRTGYKRLVTGSTSGLWPP